MRKLFLIFAVAFAFAACGGSKAKNETNEQEPVIEETIIEEVIVVDTTDINSVEVQELEPAAE